MAKRYWLFKSDPESFGLSHLKRAKAKTTMWDGVRNYQARNLLRDEIRSGDGVLFYHSQMAPPRIVATAIVTRAAYPDPTQFRRKDPYYDAKSTKEAPRWFAVDIRLDREFPAPVNLPDLKQIPALKGMRLLQKGSRLSIQPVTPKEWDTILALTEQA